MNNWCRIGLEWAVISQFQLVMPLFPIYGVAGTYAVSWGENGDVWSLRLQDDVTLPEMSSFTCRFAFSTTIQPPFCGSNW